VSQAAEIVATDRRQTNPFLQRLTTEPHGSFCGASGDVRFDCQGFKAFQYRDFRLMWIGACTSSIGTWMQIVAQGWLVYRLSHSAFLLALDQFLVAFPFFCSPARRRHRRSRRAPEDSARIAVCADGSAGLLTILVATGHVHVWHILCLSFVSGFAQASAVRRIRR